MYPVQSEADMDRMRRTTQAYMMISAWSSAGLFTALEDGKMRLLSELGGDPRALQIGAGVLGHLGILQSDGERWGLSSMGLRLQRDGVLNRGPHEANCQGLAALPKLLLEGSSLEETDIGVVEDDVERVREFMDRLYRRSDKSADHSAEWMLRWLKPGDSVLDLGGGHGRYAMAFAEKGLEATLFDKSVCVEIANERCGDRIRTLAGDFHTDDLGGPYDAIFLSNIVHGLDEDTVLSLLRRLASELKPGGRVVVKDFHTDQSTHQPETAVMFGMVMLMFTKGGRTYSVGEMQDLMALAGLSPNDPVVATDLGYELISGCLLA